MRSHVFRADTMLEYTNSTQIAQQDFDVTKTPLFARLNQPPAPDGTCHTCINATVILPRTHAVREHYGFK